MTVVAYVEMTGSMQACHNQATIFFSCLSLTANPQGIESSLILQISVFEKTQMHAGFI